MSHNRLINQACSAGLILPMTVLFGFFAGGLIVLQSYLLSGVISAVFIDKQTLPQVTPLLRGILFVVLGRVIFTVVNETLAGALAVKVKTRLRDLLLDKINRLGTSFLKGERSGELTTTAIQGVDALDAYFSQFLPQILLAVMLPLTILLVVFPLDWVTGIVFLITAPLIPLFMILIGRLSESQTRHQWKALSRLGAYFLDTLQGLSTLKILGRSKTRAEELKVVSERYRLTTMSVLRITFLSAFVLELIAMTATAVVAVEIAFRLLYSKILFRQAFFILLIAPEFYLPMRNLSARFHAGMSGLTASKRIFDLLDCPEPLQRNCLIAQRKNNPFMGSFQLVARDVFYKYPGNNINSLESINIEIESGKHYAIVGKSGAGKSTFAHLLLRFIAPDAGIISINGDNIDQWSPDDWRSWVSWVPQKPMIFNASLLENVRLRNISYSQEQVKEALKQAQMGEFLSKLPDGLNTPMQEAGYRLSGGEAQRVALARAFLKNSPLVLMDEPTAHLDIELEQELGKITNSLLDGRTSITIAHRINTVQAADEIFFFDHSRLTDRGSHRELMHRSEEYNRLVAEIVGIN
jgi:ATP-binding cassette subfamily C protein CydD